MKYKIVADSSSNVYERTDIDYSCVPLKILTSEKEYSDVKGTDITEMSPIYRAIKVNPVPPVPIYKIGWRHSMMQSLFWA